MTVAATISDNRQPTTDNRRFELELLFLAAFAAAPLYGTQAISALPLLAFHAVMIAIAARVAFGKSPEVIPAAVMRGLAIAYVPFYIIDAALISRSAIAASTHLVLFIGAYQAIESAKTRNTAQRLLTASLICTAGVATSTHIAILLFIVIFGFLLLRQLMHLSHEETIAMTGTPVAEAPSVRAASFYVIGALAIGACLFPFMPRIRNPLLPGITGPLNNATTGLSDSINLNETRSISSDATVVSRVWMGQETIPFFTPLRLKGTIYERFANNTWIQGRRDFIPLDGSDGTTRVARPEGFTRKASVQQRFLIGSRLFLPVGTYQVSGAGLLAEGPTRDIFTVWSSHRDTIAYDVMLARETAPQRPQQVTVSNYPVTPAVRAMAQGIADSESDPMRQAAKIETYLSQHFRYVADPSMIGRTMTVDQFLLRERRGHCEYFAAGMVALMTALNVPARIAGGFYGGTLNPLTGYFVIRREDAHAWVEVWDGKSWQTFDPTPASLRPGNAHEGLLRVYASALADSINYFWDRHILTFGLGDQVALAVSALESVRAAGAALTASLHTNSFRTYVSLLTMLVVAGFAAVILARRRRSLFDLLAAHLHRLGIDVGPSMTMSEALHELRMTRPAAAADLAPLIAMYEAERFSGKQERRRVRAIRAALSASSPRTGH
ncbi:MAG TPA: transglutaminaseTgpA domain-containing protein [Thermoanaerobaculia bacterium]|nr:transglutaminaseTgpA domain-containing protein [Thermoanaerobaculia bacterium]